MEKHPENISSPTVKVHLTLCCSEFWGYGRQRHHLSQYYCTYMFEGAVEKRYGD